MPTYVYAVVDDKDRHLGTYYELIQSIKEEAYEVHPETGERLLRVPQIPVIITGGLKNPRTLGSLLDKNTQDMRDRGDPRAKVSKPKVQPFWRSQQGVDTSLGNLTKEQKNRYILTGEKPK